MKRMKAKSRLMAFLGLGVALGLAVAPTPCPAADHGDGPFASVTRSGDLGDLYFFVDPNDGTRAVIIITTQGFIVPGEAVNFSVFDPEVTFRFDVDSDGDAFPERKIEVSFGPKTAASAPQTATIRLPNGRKFTAPTTTSNLSSDSPDPVVTEDALSGVSFFAGETDDPFFFDIPGFNRFVGSVLDGSPDPDQLERGRDSFAGYNTLSIVLGVPVSMLQFGNSSRTTIGISAVSLTTASRQPTFPGRRLPIVRSSTLASPLQTSSGSSQIDREGNPAVNVALVPFPRKDEYNRATPVDDANLVFANSIIGTLQALGTSEDNINVLAQVAVLNGDYLRLDTSIANTGPGGGTNPAAAFPNGRRLGDDVIDTLMTIITNGGITTGDNVDANDVPFRDSFPYTAATHQPFEPGTLDDRTRN